MLLMNFKNHENCGILKMRKKSSLVKITSVFFFVEVS